MKTEKKAPVQGSHADRAQIIFFVDQTLREGRRDKTDCCRRQSLDNQSQLTHQAMHNWSPDAAGFGTVHQTSRRPL
jgi:hypothetical protein